VVESWPLSLKGMGFLGGTTKTQVSHHLEGSWLVRHKLIMSRGAESVHSCKGEKGLEVLKTQRRRGLAGSRT